MLRICVNMPGLVHVFFHPRMSLALYLDVPNEGMDALTLVRYSSNLHTLAITERFRAGVERVVRRTDREEPGTD